MDEGYAYRYGYARGGLENALKDIKHIIKYSKTDDGTRYTKKRTLMEADFQRLLGNIERNLEALDTYDKQ